MKSKQRRKANRNFVLGAKKEIRELLGQALMDGGKLKDMRPPCISDFAAHADFHQAMGDWTVRSQNTVRLFKKCLSAGLIDRAGVVTQKGLEVLKND